MEAAGRGGRMAGQPQAKKKRNTVSSPEECPVCLTCYYGRVKRPHSLPCGHTVCTLCIDQLKKHGCVACPECCVIHAMPTGGQFPVNFAVEAFTRKRHSEVVAAAAAAASSLPSAGKVEGASGMKGAAGLCKYMSSLLEEQVTKVEAAITACWEARSQLDQYQTTLVGWVKRQQQLEDRLLELVNHSMNARDILQQEESRVTAKEEELMNWDQGLQAVLETLRTHTTDQEVGMAVTEAVRYTGKAVKGVEECRECFPDATTVTTMRDTEEASSTALESVQATLETLATGEPRPQSDPDSTIMDRMHFIWTGSLTAKDLLSLTQPARRLLEAGRVFAVHPVEGQRRHAKISLEAGQLCLHALKDHPPPRGAVTLQVSDIVPPSPPCTVFLDLSWPGSALRRVKIRLSPDTPRGRHFLLLCTGQRGPSYVNTRLFKVWRKGDTGEYVKGGHFMSNNGHWTSTMLPGLDKGQVEYRYPNHAGDVFGLKSGGRSQCGRFGIFTTDRQSGGLSSHSLFGKVVEGLHVVAEAAKHPDIEEVTVLDCGVVLKVLPTATTTTATTTTTIMVT